MPKRHPLRKIRQIVNDALGRARWQGTALSGTVVFMRFPRMVLQAASHDGRAAAPADKPTSEPLLSRRLWRRVRWLQAKCKSLAEREASATCFSVSVSLPVVITVSMAPSMADTIR